MYLWIQMSKIVFLSKTSYIMCYFYYTSSLLLMLQYQENQSTLDKRNEENDKENYNTESHWVIWTFSKVWFNVMSTQKYFNLLCWFNNSEIDGVFRKFSQQS